MKNAGHIIILVSISVTLSAQLDNLKEEVGKIIRYDTEIDFERTPGSVIGVVDMDSTFIFPIGKEEMVDQLSGESIFEIGSVTKVLTAALATTMINEGFFTRESLINDLIPAQYRNPRFSGLTVGDLLNHYGGFPKIPKMFGATQKLILDPYAHYSKAELFKYYKEYVPQKKEQKFEYSHLGYAILELVIEETGKKNYHDLIREKLFLPLEMKNSFIDFSEKKETVTGYNLALRKAGPWHFQSFAASEGAKSTVNDLCKFIRAHFEDNSTPLSSLLGNAMQIEARTTYNDKIFIGNGWHIFEQSGKYEVYTHTGKTSGHSAFLAIIKDTHTGVVILSNSVHGTRDLGMLILRMINDNWKRKL